MRYYGESNVPGAPGIKQPFVAGGIPVGEDPIFPMSQEHFSDYVRYKLDQHKPLTPSRVDKVTPGPQLPPFLNRGVKGASTFNDSGFPIGNMGGMQLAQVTPSAELLQAVPAQPSSVDLSQFSDVLDRLTEQAIEKSKYGRPLQRVEYPF